jgi:stringent starvation protein B
MKRHEAILKMLDMGLVKVMLDPRVEGVRLPEHLKNQPALTLNFSYWHKGSNVQVDDTGVYANLSFNGVNSLVSVPWPAIFALRAKDDSGLLFSENLPPEMVVTSWAPSDYGPNVKIEEVPFKVTKIESDRLPCTVVGYDVSRTVDMLAKMESEGFKPEEKPRGLRIVPFKGEK